MAKFIKHLGMHQGKKVVVLWRKVPSEDHMALVVYTDMLPQLIADAVMGCLESAVGQAEENFAEALHRTRMQDGSITLSVLHQRGMIKKVQTAAITMTPATGQHIVLSELNTLLDEIAQSKNVSEKMAKRDNTAKNMANYTNQPIGEQPLNTNDAYVLSDGDIAQQRVAQATRLRTEAKSLLDEADRLMSEAAALNPSVVSKPGKEKASATASKEVTEPKAKRPYVRKQKATETKV